MNRMFKKTGGLWVAVVMGTLVAWVPPASADVVIFTNGKVRKGLTEPIEGNNEQIRMTDAQGTFSIPKSRIKEIQPESRAQGYVHIGDQFRAEGNLALAIKNYQIAVDLDSTLTAARTALDEVQAEIAKQKELTRQEAIGDIDKLVAEGEALFKQGKFDAAQEKFQQAGHLVPTGSQRTRLQSVISEMYLAWADERRDKLDIIGAEEKLKLALAANPENETVITELLAIWENNPDRREQSVLIYESMLERHPTDNNLRQKVADLYYDMSRREDALKHYLKLYQSSVNFRNTQVERRIITILEDLHGHYARLKDYSKAIEYFKLLSSIDPNTNPTQILFYEYLKMRSELAEDDYKGQLTLAQYAEQNGLEQEALDGYRALAGKKDVDEAARQGIARFARRRLNEATEQFNAANYQMAQVMAENALKDFGNVEGVREEVATLIGHAQVQIARDLRERAAKAEDLVKRGDEFYEQANLHFNNIFSTERRDLPYLSNSRVEAIKYYRLTISAYEQALQINPDIKKDPTSLINIRLSEARQRYANLTSNAAVRPRGFTGRRASEYQD